MNEVQTKNKLREIFNRHDLEELYFGRNINFDEYDSEIDMACIAFKKSRNQKEFTDKLYQIFRKMFNNDVAP